MIARMQSSPEHPSDRLTSRGLTVTAIAATLYGLAPTTLITGAIREGMWDSQLLLGFPLLALACCAFFLMAGLVRPTGSLPLRSVALTATIVVLFSLVHIVTDREASLVKMLAMLLASTIVPSVLAWVSGPRHAMYATAAGILLWLSLLLVGSILLPELLFVPAYASYQPERSGWFVNPNAYGAAGLVAQCIVFLLLADKPWPILHQRTWRGLLVGILVFAVAAVLRSASRASLIATLSFWLLVLFVNRRASTLFAVALAATAALAFLPDLLVGMHDMPVFETFLLKLQRPSISGGRVELWSALIERTLSSNPVFGLGAGSSIKASEALGYSGTHNAYLKILVEFGLTGLGVILFVIFRVGQTLLRWDRNGIRARAVAVVFVVLLAHSMFESHIFSFASTPIGVLFWQYSILARTDAT